MARALTTEEKRKEEEKAQLKMWRTKLCLASVLLLILLHDLLRPLAVSLLEIWGCGWEIPADQCEHDVPCDDLIVTWSRWCYDLLTGCRTPGCQCVEVDPTLCQAGSGTLSPEQLNASSKLWLTQHSEHLAVVSLVPNHSTDITGWTICSLSNTWGCGTSLCPSNLPEKGITYTTNIATGYTALFFLCYLGTTHLFANFCECLGECVVCTFKQLLRLRLRQVGTSRHSNWEIRVEGNDPANGPVITEYQDFAELKPNERAWEFAAIALYWNAEFWCAIGVSLYTQIRKPLCDAGACLDTRPEIVFAFWVAKWVDNWVVDCTSIPWVQTLIHNLIIGQISLNLIWNLPMKSMELLVVYARQKGLTRYKIQLMICSWALMVVLLGNSWGIEAVYSAYTPGTIVIVGHHPLIFAFLNFLVAIAKSAAMGSLMKSYQNCRKKGELSSATEQIPDAAVGSIASMFTAPILFLDPANDLTIKPEQADGSAAGPE